MDAIIPKYQIRADFDAHTLIVYQAYGTSIADQAIKAQKFVAPFYYTRMTWIKPSFLWVMYRSNWGRTEGMHRILKIRIQRKYWDSALAEGVLTTPELHVYPNAKKWRPLLDKARIRVQWDPERDILNNRLDHKAIQVGITHHLCEEYAKKWIVSIEEISGQVKTIRKALDQRKIEEAKKMLPKEFVYPVNEKMRAALGID